MKMFFLSSNKVRRQNKVTAREPLKQQQQKQQQQQQQQHTQKPPSYNHFRRKRGSLPIFNLSKIITTRYPPSCKVCGG